jgi:hypothetical protein
MCVFGKVHEAGDELRGSCSSMGGESCLDKHAVHVTPERRLSDRQMVQHRWQAGAC